ncbi:MAG: hypothetical protein ACI32N_01700 [Bulleidia sp.]
MMIIRLAIRNLRKRWIRTAALIAVCFTAFHMAIVSVTTVGCYAMQKQIFEEYLRWDMKQVLQLEYSQSHETDDFTDTLQQFQKQIREITGVRDVGQADATGMYFRELKSSQEYIEVNRNIVADTRYADDPDITQVIRMDECMLSMMDIGVSSFEIQDGKLPVYVSESYRDVIPIGTILHDDYLQDIYVVSGYIPKGKQWMDENDLIRFPLISMDGKCIIPWSDNSRSDLMTQLSALHNTYVFPEENADIRAITDQIHTLSKQMGFAATAHTLADLYEQYRSETEMYTQRHIALALFLSAMALTSLTAMFAAGTLLQKKKYGIYIANGMTLSGTALCIAAEITVMVSVPLLSAWAVYWFHLNESRDLFRQVLMRAHTGMTLPVCMIAGVVLVLVSSLIPALRIFHYRPCELTGGNSYGNH